jgi:hypothetical protein
VAEKEYLMKAALCLYFVAICCIASFFLSDTRLRDQPDFSFHCKWMITLVALYAGCFILLQRLLYRRNASRLEHTLFIAFFLLTCPTVESYQRINFGGEFYGTPTEKKTAVNSGDAYNRVNLFGLAAFNLFVIKEPVRFEQSYFVKNRMSPSRLGAVGHSRTYQIHLLSVLFTLTGFLFIYRRTYHRLFKRIH